MNVGSTDRKVRMIAGLAVFALAFFLSNGVASTTFWLLLAIGVVLVTTALIKFCPAYRLFNISTRKSRR